VSASASASASLTQRMAIGLLRGVTKTLWGAPPFLLPQIVEHLGAFGALSWFAKNLPEYEAILKDWGPIRTHLLCVEASLLNGCSYCTHAHAYAFELYYFREKGRLFALDEHELIALRDGTDAELCATLEAALIGGDLHDERPLLARILRLKLDQAKPADRTDERIGHLLKMFEMLNFCGIASQTPFDHAHDPINKDAALKLRYAEARLAQS
jgi:hypothetical protein